MDKRHNQLDDNAPHLLVVDDDKRIRELISQYLTQNGYRLTTARDAADARKRLAGLAFDLIILDVMMPGETGIELTQFLNKSISPTPILMLTALSDTEDRVEGLSSGADDYLAKPFDPRELLLRIKNLLKRQTVQNPSIKQEHLTFGPFTFSIKKRELKKAGAAIRLTEREQVILGIFAESAGNTVKRQDLYAHGHHVGERTVDVQINRLRRKLEDDPANPAYLQTVRGTGYKLCID